MNKAPPPCAILLVDDEEGILNLLKPALGKNDGKNYTLHLAENGNEAWKIDPEPCRYQ